MGIGPLGVEYRDLLDDPRHQHAGRHDPVSQAEYFGDGGLREGSTVEERSPK